MSQLFPRPVHDILLKGSDETPWGLYHLNLATAEQLRRLHSYKKGSINGVKAHLKELDDGGYIQHDTIPSKEINAPYYYTMTRKGLEYLAGLGLEVNDALRDSKEVDKGFMFVEHTLELNDVLIACALIRKAEPRFYLHGFIHERTLKKTPYKAVWMVNGQLEDFTLIPDAFLDLRRAMPDSKQRRMPILLEHDRGTEQRKFFQQRIKAYSVLLQSGAYKQHFGVKAITIAFTTFAGEPRLKQMLEWTRQEVGEADKTLGPTFLFGAFNQPLELGQLLLEPCWFTPYRAEAMALAQV